MYFYPPYRTKKFGNSFFTHWHLKSRKFRWNNGFNSAYRGTLLTSRRSVERNESSETCNGEKFDEIEIFAKEY